MGKLIYFCAGMNKSRHPKSDIQGILISSAAEGKSDKSISYILKVLEKIKYQYLILDSGGYQLIVAEQKGTLKKSNIMRWLTPKHVMAAAAKINPDIVMALDYPTLNLTDPKEQVQEFNRKIFTNIKWSRECIELKSLYCPESQLFLPVQAYNTKQMDIFFRQLNSDLFDGVSLPTRNASPQQLIQQFLYLHNMGIRKVHVLGSSTFANIIISAFMARNYFDWVSLDSTTWRQQAQFGVYLHPENLSPIKLKTGKKYSEIKCSCPWCQYQSLDDYSNLPDTDCSYLLLNHNHFVIGNLCKETFCHSGSLDSLIKFCSPRSTNKSHRTMTKLFESLHLFEILAGVENGCEKMGAMLRKT